MGKGNQKEALKLESIVCETTIATTKKWLQNNKHCFVFLPWTSCTMEQHNMYGNFFFFYHDSVFSSPLFRQQTKTMTNSLGWTVALFPPLQISALGPEGEKVRSIWVSFYKMWSSTCTHIFFQWRTLLLLTWDCSRKIPKVITNSPWRIWTLQCVKAFGTLVSRLLSVSLVISLSLVTTYLGMWI
jgi:hypothetical protein